MIAQLILMTYLTFPALSMGMSSVESNHNFLVKGDKGRAHGMFQIQPRHHGYVPKSVTGQMAKHDAVLLEFLEACGLNYVEGVRSYNGGPFKAQSKQTKKATKIYYVAVTHAMLEQELLGTL